jgi:hypothetical protein
VPPNDVPVARCDSYRVKPGGTLFLPRPGVLGNDSDPDGDPLRAVSHPSGTETTPSPGVHSNGSIRFSAPTKPRMLSYRYAVRDGRLETTTTLTIWVGMKDRGCRPASDPPPRSALTETLVLRRTTGVVRFRSGGGWRSLGASQRLTRQTTVDARRGSVRVRVVREDNYDRRFHSGRSGGGVFRLGRTIKLPNGKVVAGFFNEAELAGDLGCRRCVGPGRRLKVAAPSGFIVETTRLRTCPLVIRNRPTVARYAMTDRCTRRRSSGPGRDGST